MADFVLICGSRDWTNHHLVAKRIKEFPPDVIILEGGARGADLLAGEACRNHQRPFLEYPAPWDEFRRMGNPKGAGIFRNKRMLELRPKMVVAFSDIPITRGTLDMCKRALDNDLPVQLITPSGERQTLSKSTIKRLETQGG